MCVYRNLKHATRRQTNRLLSAQSGGYFYKICKNVPPAGFQRSIILAPVAEKPSHANIRLKGRRQDFNTDHLREGQQRPQGCCAATTRHRSSCTFVEIFILEQVSHHLNLYLTSAQSDFYLDLCVKCVAITFLVRLLTVGPLLLSGQRSRKKRHQGEEKRLDMCRVL